MLTERAVCVWNAECDLPDILPMRTLVRLRQLVTDERGRDTILTAVWTLENGYSNVGTYVVELRTEVAQVEYDLIVQYGMTYHTMRRNQPKAHLLALDGFEIIVEYREQILGVTIDPTDEQMQAFLGRYEQGIEEWIAHCQTLSEMRHPRYMSTLEILESICSFFSETELTQHIRGRRYARDLLTEQTRFGPPKPQSALAALQNAHTRARDQLYEIWKKNCADYDFPAPPLGMDRQCSQILPTFVYQKQTYKKVALFGQVAVIPIIPPFSSATSPSYDLVVYESRRKINTWLSTKPGGRDGAYTYAQSLSALLDWQQFETLTLRTLRGVEVRIHELLIQTVSTYSSTAGI